MILLISTALPARGSQSTRITASSSPGRGACSSKGGQQGLQAVQLGTPSLVCNPFSTDMPCSKSSACRGAAPFHRQQDAECMQGAQSHGSSGGVWKSSISQQWKQTERLNTAQKQAQSTASHTASPYHADSKTPQQPSSAAHLHAQSPGSSTALCCVYSHTHGASPRN